MTEQTQGTPRRRFLVLSGTALGGAALCNVLGADARSPDALDAAAQQISPESAADIFGWPIFVRRPQDQLLLTITGFNTSIDYTQSPPVLTKIADAFPSYLGIQFGRTRAQYGGDGFTAPAPMHVAEQAYPLNDSDLPRQKNAPLDQKPTAAVQAPPVGSRIAGATQLAFVLPDDMLAPGSDSPITLTTDDLLNWVNLLLSVVPNAVPPINPLAPPTGLGAPRAPEPGETAIELPYHLVLSPPVRPTSNPNTFDSVIFVNSKAPVTHNGWTELWHTRLATRLHRTVGDFSFFAVDETNRDLRTVRAIWSTDPNFAADLAANKSDDKLGSTPPSFTSSLRYVDRYDIVRLSADFTPDSQGGPYRRGATRTSPGYLPSPATVDRLMLTSLGGWLDCDAHWDLPNSTTKNKFNTSLLSWRHRAVQARDSYVRVVRKGYLFPWGHKASLVTIAEREFTEKTPSGAVGAYLRQKTFIVVTAPVKSYAGNDSIDHGGRNIPFTSVEALTLVTPDLQAPVKYTSTQATEELLFQPRNLDGSPYKFHFRGTDRAGDPIDMHTPVLWVDDTVAYADSTTMTQAFTNWKTKYPVVHLAGQRVSMAVPKDPTAPAGATQLVLASFELGVEAPKNGVSAGHLSATSQPRFFPALHSAAVKLPEAEAASGGSVGTTTMEYESGHYLANEFNLDPNQGVVNPGGVFLQRSGGATRHTINFRTDKSGGAITPNLGVDGISREIGPLSAGKTGSLHNLALGTFDPEDVFHGVDAKLLGGIPLQAILNSVGFGDGANSQALELTSVERLDPHRIVTTLDWHPEITSGGPTVAGQEIEVFVPDTDPSSDSMDLHAVIVTDLMNPANSTSTVVGQIRDFEIRLFGDEQFVTIPFDSLTFRSQSGKKTDVDVAIGADGVQFQGALSFVQDLADYLSFAGSGLVIDTSGDAITATLTLAIPTIAVGVFALENLAFLAGVAIPYNGDPVRFDFSFCTRDNPFQLEIMIFTGGGFVGLGIGPDGVELLEFSFDFGLGISIDIGIASGEVSLTGGVYFELEKQNDGRESVDLTAYVKAYGGISALGIVSVSVELYLALVYQSDGTSSQLSGDAEMTISVHVLFFGGDIGFSVHEEFAGSGPSAFAANARQQALAGPPADPPPHDFGTYMTAQDWAEYCTSFALIGVGV